MWRKRAKAISEDERVVRSEAESRERTMNRAVKLLAAKPRSTAELRKRLLEKRWTNDEIVDSVIEKLKGYKYLDDEQFACDFSLSKLRQKPQGRRRLEQSLSQKHLDREVIDQAITKAFEKMPEEMLIDDAIAKRVRSKGVPKTRDETKKLCDHLLRLGFGYDLIRTKLSSLTKTDDRSA